MECGLRRTYIVELFLHFLPWHISQQRDKLSTSNDAIFGRFEMWECSTCDIWHIKEEGSIEANLGVEWSTISGDFWQIFIVRLTLSGARGNLMPLNEVLSPPFSPFIRLRCCHFGGWIVCVLMSECWHLIILYYYIGIKIVVENDLTWFRTCVTFFSFAYGTLLLLTWNIISTDTEVDWQKIIVEICRLRIIWLRHIRKYNMRLLLMTWHGHVMAKYNIGYCLYSDKVMDHDVLKKFT